MPVTVRTLGAEATDGSDAAEGGKWGDAARALVRVRDTRPTAYPHAPSDALEKAEPAPL